MTSRLPWKKRIAVATGVAILFASTVVGAFIYLSSFPADQGTFAPLGQSTVNFPTNADHIATQTEYAGLALNVTSTGSLTSTHYMFLPCIPGEAKFVTNSTTGSQAIAVACDSSGSPAGTFVTIANGQSNSTTVLSPDGINYVSVGGGASGGGLPAGTGLVAVIDGGGYTFSCTDGGVLYLDGGVYPTCDPLISIPLGGTNSATLPSEGQFSVASSSSVIAPTTITGDNYCSTTVPGQCIVVQATGDGGLNGWGYNGQFPILTSQATLNFNGTTKSSSIDLGSMVTIDGGINCFPSHLIGAGTARGIRATISGRSNCQGTVDSEFCTLKAWIASQTDAGNTTQTPTSPTCVEGAPVPINGGSNYGTPTMVTDGGYITICVQGVADAGCVDGGIDWGASLEESPIVQ